MKCPKCQQSDEVVTRVDSPYCLRCGEALPPATGSAAIHLIRGERREVRVMAVAEGWAMVRRKGAMPYVAKVSEIFPPNTEVVATAAEDATSN